MDEKTPFKLETDSMINEIIQNGVKAAAKPPRPTKLPGVWAPSELWPGEDYMHVNNAFTDYRLT